MLNQKSLNGICSGYQFVIFSLSEISHLKNVLNVGGNSPTEKIKEV